MMDPRSRLYIKLAIVILAMAAGIAVIGKIMYSSYGSKPFRKEVELCVQAFDDRDGDAAIRHYDNAMALLPPVSSTSEYQSFMEDEGENIALLKAIKEWLDYPVLEITEWSFQAGSSYRDKYPPAFNDGRPDPMLSVVRNDRIIWFEIRSDTGSFEGRPKERLFIKEGDALCIAEDNFTSSQLINALVLNRVIRKFPPEKSGEWFTISNIEDKAALCKVRVVYPTARSVREFVKARIKE